MMAKWYELPLDRRAPRGGEVGLNGRDYRGGEVLPFYVPRIEMPQIDESQYTEFMRFLRSKNVGIKYVSEPAVDFRNHQRVKIDKARLANVTDFELNKPVLAASDRFIVDGNHRWWIRRERGLALDAYVIDLPFGKAVGMAFSFPGVKTESGEK